MHYLQVEQIQEIPQLSEYWEMKWGTEQGLMWLKSSEESNPSSKINHCFKHILIQILIWNLILNMLIQVQLIWTYHSPEPYTTFLTNKILQENIPRFLIICLLNQSSTNTKILEIAGFYIHYLRNIVPWGRKMYAILFWSHTLIGLRGPHKMPRIEAGLAIGKANTVPARATPCNYFTWFSVCFINSANLEHPGQFQNFSLFIFHTANVLFFLFLLL